MAIAIVSHKVKDFKVWKPFYDEDKQRRQGMGIKELKQGHKADDPNEIYFVWEIEDPAKFQAGAQDPGLHAIMEKAGVIGGMNVTIIDEFK